MADVKWIKITTDIFDDEKILLIESLPDAYAIIVVWFKLLCLAGKQNNSGVFMMNEKIAYTDKMLATIFRMKESTVTMALGTFEQFGMIEIVDGVITIPNWGKHQNLDQLETKKKYMRNYMKEYREKQKLLAAPSDSSDDNDIGYATWLSIKQYFNNECAYCGKSVRLEKEHVIPFTKGGTLSVDNIVPACRKCNASKGANDFEDWYKKSDVFNEERYLLIKEYLDTGFRKCLRKTTVNEADKEEDKEIDKEKYESIISYLNEKAGTHYRPTTAKTKTAIHARLAEGFSVDDFKTVIDKKCADWLGTEYEQYLRPETLFGTKFEGYLNAKVRKKTSGQPIDESLNDLDGIF